MTNCEVCNVEVVTPLITQWDVHTHETCSTVCKDKLEAAIAKAEMKEEEN